MIKFSEFFFSAVLLFVLSGCFSCLLFLVMQSEFVHFVLFCFAACQLIELTLLAILYNKISLMEENDES